MKKEATYNSKNNSVSQNYEVTLKWDDKFSITMTTSQVPDTEYCD